MTQANFWFNKFFSRLTTTLQEYHRLELKQNEQLFQLDGEISPIMIQTKRPMITNGLKILDWDHLINQGNLERRQITGIPLSLNNHFQLIQRGPLVRYLSLITTLKHLIRLTFKVLVLSLWSNRWPYRKHRREVESSSWKRVPRSL